MKEEQSLSPKASKIANHKKLKLKGALSAAIKMKKNLASFIQPISKWWLLVKKTLDLKWHTHFVKRKSAQIRLENLKDEQALKVFPLCRGFSSFLGEKKTLVISFSGGRAGTFSTWPHHFKSSSSLGNDETKGAWL